MSHLFLAVGAVLAAAAGFAGAAVFAGAADGAGAVGFAAAAGFASVFAFAVGGGAAGAGGGGLAAAIAASSACRRSCSPPIRRRHVQMPIAATAQPNKSGSIRSVHRQNGNHGIISDRTPIMMRLGLPAICIPDCDSSVASFRVATRPHRTPGKRALVADTGGQPFVVALVAVHLVLD
jgi:hypothetical protein